MQIKGVNPNKLHGELISEGIHPILVEHDLNDGEFVAENTWITFKEGTDMDSVQQLVNKHDPTPLPSKPTEIEKHQEIINTLGQELSMLKLQIMMGGI